ncbi:MAG: uroporphyrinogen decarboxylase, partial [Chloroflexi bacterium]|nr:uroporphyrinogen decarboxylase [Chloroflexota bacterium]
AVGPEVPVTGLVPSPFLLAGTLRGAEALMRDFFSNRRFIEELSLLCIDYTSKYALLLVEAGADVIRLVNPFANASCISRKHYQEFVHPYTRQMLARLKAKGIRVIFHTCGRWDDRLDLVTSEGADILHVDKMDLLAFKQSYGGRVGVMGNVKTVDTMLLGRPQDVERESRECIRQAGTGGGYILSADCVLPRDTPVENIQAMVSAARKYGCYLQQC